MRRRAMRRAFLLPVAAAAMATALVACGGGSGESSTAGKEQNADVGVMNEILGRQLAAVKAYEGVLPALAPADRAIAEKLRTQEQEHVDAVIKALRGLGGEAEPPAESIRSNELKTRADKLNFFYQIENATIDAEMSAISKLTAPGPRVLLVAIVANQAQHLALLRRALGAKPLETIPVPFENGTTPAP